MKRILSICVAALILSACSSPNDIVFGPEPLKQLAEQGEKFKRMPEADRMLLVGYLTVQQMSSAFGGDFKPVAGRTVGEVMKDARAWQERVKLAKAEEDKHALEAAALRAKVEAENKKLTEKIAGLLTVAVTDKVVLPKNYDVGRYSPLLMIKYALENKSGKPIRQVKGTVVFVDPTGDKIGDLPVEFNDVIKPGATLKTDTGSGWRVSGFGHDDIERIANRDFSAMSGTFKVSSIAFEGGEVLKLAD